MIMNVIYLKISIILLEDEFVFPGQQGKVGAFHEVFVYDFENVAVVESLAAFVFVHDGGLDVVFLEVVVPFFFLLKLFDWRFGVFVLSEEVS